MESKLTKQFLEKLQKLDPKVQALAKKSFELWKENPEHVKFKKLKASAQYDIYSAQVSESFRSICYKDNDNKCYVWFWIGSHAEFDLMCGVKKNDTLQHTAHRIQSQREVLNQIKKIRDCANPTLQNKKTV